MSASYRAAVFLVAGSLLAFVFFIPAAYASQDSADLMCAPETGSCEYGSFCDYPKNTVRGVVGKPCQDITNGIVAAKGHCVAWHKCLATTCGSGECKTTDVKVDQSQNQGGEAKPAPSLTDGFPTQVPDTENPTPSALQPGLIGPDKSIFEAAAFKLEPGNFEQAPSADAFQKFLEQTQSQHEGQSFPQSLGEQLQQWGALIPGLGNGQSLTPVDAEGNPIGDSLSGGYEVSGTTGFEGAGDTPVDVCGFACKLPEWTKTALGGAADAAGKALSTIGDAIFGGAAESKPLDPNVAKNLIEAADISCKYIGGCANPMAIAQGWGGSTTQESQSDPNFNEPANDKYRGIWQLDRRENNLRLETLDNMAKSPNLSAAEQETVRGVAADIRQALAEGKDPRSDARLGTWMGAARQVEIKDMNLSPLKGYSDVTNPGDVAAATQLAQLAPNSFASKYIDGGQPLSRRAIDALAGNKVGVSPGATFNDAIAAMQNSKTYSNNFSRGIGMVQQNASPASPPLDIPPPVYSQSEISVTPSYTAEFDNRFQPAEIVPPSSFDPSPYQPAVNPPLASWDPYAPPTQGAADFTPSLPASPTIAVESGGALPDLSAEAQAIYAGNLAVEGLGGPTNLYGPQTQADVQAIYDSLPRYASEYFDPNYLSLTTPSDGTGVDSRLAFDQSPVNPENIDTIAEGAVPLPDTAITDPQGSIEAQNAIEAARLAEDGLGPNVSGIRTQAEVQAIYDAQRAADAREAARLANEGLVSGRSESFFSTVNKTLQEQFDSAYKTITDAGSRVADAISGRAPEGSLSDIPTPPSGGEFPPPSETAAVPNAPSGDIALSDGPSTPPEGGAGESTPTLIERSVDTVRDFGSRIADAVSGRAPEGSLSDIPTLPSGGEIPPPSGTTAADAQAPSNWDNFKTNVANAWDGTWDRAKNIFAGISGQTPSGPDTMANETGGASAIPSGTGSQTDAGEDFRSAGTRLPDGTVVSDPGEDFRSAGTQGSVGDVATAEPSGQFVENVPLPLSRPAVQQPPTALGDSYSRGETGEGVKSVQQFLNSRGANIKEDGIYGPQTEAAVRAFQRDQNLRLEDGLAGPKTIARMNEIASNGVGLRGIGSDYVASQRNGTDPLPIDFGAYSSVGSPTDPSDPGEDFRSAGTLPSPTSPSASSEVTNDPGEEYRSAGALPPPSVPGGVTPQPEESTGALPKSELPTGEWNPSGEATQQRTDDLQSQIKETESEIAAQKKLADAKRSLASVQRGLSAMRDEIGSPLTPAKPENVAAMNSGLAQTKQLAQTLRSPEFNGEGDALAQQISSYASRLDALNRMSGIAKLNEAQRLEREGSQLAVRTNSFIGSLQTDTRSLQTRLSGLQLQYNTTLSAAIFTDPLRRFSRGGR